MVRGNFVRSKRWFGDFLGVVAVVVDGKCIQLSTKSQVLEYTTVGGIPLLNPPSELTHHHCIA
jgi:hypothetical protein